MKETFRTRLQQGETLFGIMVSLGAPEVTEILAEVGFDWFFVDLEHTPLGPREAETILRAAGEVDCILRLPLNDEIWIKKALDSGASGIMLPQVNTAEEARRAVRLSKYPPEGSRSVGISRAHGYGARLQSYLDRANKDIAVIVQIEHDLAVQNVEAIAAVEGIDALLVGPYDLSASMGLMGQVEHPEVQSAIARVREVCDAYGLPVGIFAASPARARAYADQGFRLVAAASDSLLLGQAAMEALGVLKD